MRAVLGRDKRACTVPANLSARVNFPQLHVTLQAENARNSLRGRQHRSVLCTDHYQFVHGKEPVRPIATAPPAPQPAPDLSDDEETNSERLARAVDALAQTGDADEEQQESLALTPCGTLVPAADKIRPCTGSCAEASACKSCYPPSRPPPSRSGSSATASSQSATDDPLRGMMHTLKKILTDCGQDQIRVRSQWCVVRDNTLVIADLPLHTRYGNGTAARSAQSAINGPTRRKKKPKTGSAPTREVSVSSSASTIYLERMSPDQLWQKALATNRLPPSAEDTTCWLRQHELTRARAGLKLPHPLLCVPLDAPYGHLQAMYETLPLLNVKPAIDVKLSRSNTGAPLQYKLVLTNDVKKGSPVCWYGGQPTHESAYKEGGTLAGDRHTHARKMPNTDYVLDGGAWASMMSRPCAKQMAMTVKPHPDITAAQVWSAPSGYPTHSSVLNAWISICQSGIDSLMPGRGNHSPQALAAFQTELTACRLGFMANTATPGSSLKNNTSIRYVSFAGNTVDVPILFANQDLKAGAELLCRYVGQGAKSFKYLSGVLDYEFPPKICLDEFGAEQSQREWKRQRIERASFASSPAGLAQVASQQHAQDALEAALQSYSRAKSTPPHACAECHCAQAENLASLTDQVAAGDAQQKRIDAAAAAAAPEVKSTPPSSTPVHAQERGAVGKRKLEPEASVVASSSNAIALKLPLASNNDLLYDVDPEVILPLADQLDAPRAPERAPSELTVIIDRDPAELEQHKADSMAMECDEQLAPASASGSSVVVPPEVLWRPQQLTSSERKLTERQVLHRGTGQTPTARWHKESDNSETLVRPEALGAGAPSDAQWQTYLASQEFALRKAAHNRYLRQVLTTINDKPCSGPCCSVQCLLWNATWQRDETNALQPSNFGGFSSPSFSLLASTSEFQQEQTRANKGRPRIFGIRSSVKCFQISFAQLACWRAVSKL